MIISIMDMSKYRELSKGNWIIALEFIRFYLKCYAFTSILLMYSTGNRLDGSKYYTKKFSYVI